MEVHCAPHNAAARLAAAIYGDTLDAVRADRLVLDALRLDGTLLRAGDWSRDLAAVRRLYVVGAGKASAAMAWAVEQRLGDRITEGVVVTKHGYAPPPDSRRHTRRIRVLDAGHPVPDADSVAAGQAIHNLATRADADDLVLCLLSGGASALMELPVEGVSLDDLRKTTDLLLRAGAPIEDLNAVRACLSQLKAGGLARAAAPAPVLCLVLSDVLGSPLAVIGSGPCVDNPADPAAALAALARYGLTDRVPAAVRAALEQGRQGDKETRRQGDKETADRTAPLPTLNTQHSTLNTHHLLLADLWTALEAARAAAERRGLRPVILTGWLTGEAREVGRVFGGIARDMPRTHGETGVDCYVAGGETTVTVRGSGRGGRSQELAAAASSVMAGTQEVALLAGGTDGTDGPTDAAGGLVDGGTLARAQAAGADLDAALAENAAYDWLARADGLVKTGPTDSNVGDVALVVFRAGGKSGPPS